MTDFYERTLRELKTRPPKSKQVWITYKNRQDVAYAKKIAAKLGLRFLGVNKYDMMVFSK